MKKLILILFLFVLFLPLITEAAGLVPCGRSEDDLSTPRNESSPCTTCDLLVLFQNVLKFALEIAFLIVVGFIIYGGFRWIFSAGNEVNIKAGQQTITNALIGLAIILCAWLIVNTVFWLVKTIGGADYTGTGTLPWFQLECTYPESKTDNDGNNGNGDGDGGGNGGGNGGGAIQNWCGDMAGYACVEGSGWNPNCNPATVVLTDPNITHCPPGTICCIPADESKIVAEPKNPEPPNPGGPCEGGQLLKLCPNYSVCLSHQCPNQPIQIWCSKGAVMRCPEACIHECDCDEVCKGADKCP